MMALSVKCQLKNGFYLSSCPKAEAIVRSVVELHSKHGYTVAAGLLRLHFHDCFVQVCGDSVLITGASVERNALPNLGLRGFEVIDNAKSQLEAACPGVVSCADIVALDARDSVDLLALSTEVHTIRTTACVLFSYRLYNFTKTGNTDTMISQSFPTQLQALCPKDSDGTKRVAPDQGSQGDFDTRSSRTLETERECLSRMKDSGMILLQEMLFKTMQAISEDY